jgi:hypothetical protein
VATLGLGGGQVAVLRLHAAVCWLRNDCTILTELGERITQLQYLLHLSLRAAENTLQANFREFVFHDVREYKGKKEDRKRACNPEQ